jgi:hypothetical protein
VEKVGKNWATSVIKKPPKVNNPPTGKYNGLKFAQSGVDGHNFLQFLPIFGEKIGVFLKNQCYDQCLHSLALF